jgi:hypothetical protein
MSGRFHWVARSAVVALAVFAVACSTKEEPGGAAHSAAKGARPPRRSSCSRNRPGAAG